MDTRLKATRYIWVAYTLTMVVLFLGNSINEYPISAGHVVVAIGASIMAFLSTGAVWNWGDVRGADAISTASTSDAKKRKNQAKLEGIISRLSDEERDALREKLADDIAQYGISDDGELVSYR
jgi:hypothetical protein